MIGEIWIGLFLKMVIYYGYHNFLSETLEHDILNFQKNKGYEKQHSSSFGKVCYGKQCTTQVRRRKINSANQEGLSAIFYPRQHIV